MGREIKFRAWDKRFGTFLDDVAKGESDGLNEIFSNTEDGNIVFMQYIGLKDKNGVEIYEGDIVRASLLGDGRFHGAKDEVQFVGNGIIDIDPISLMVNFKDGNRDSFYDYDAILHRETEVIGNIYENPELLESK